MKCSLCRESGESGHNRTTCPKDPPRAQAGRLPPALPNELMRVLISPSPTLVPAKYKSFTDGAEWLVDHLNEKEEKRVAKAIAKNDASLKATCAQHGTHAARFKTADQSIGWIEFTDENAGRQKAEKKHRVLTNWTVIA